MLAWLLTSRVARALTALTLALYACAAITVGALLAILGVTQLPVPGLNGLAPDLVPSIFPGFIVALAWMRGRATSDRIAPGGWLWPSRVGRAEEFPLYFFGKAMPTPLKTITIVLLAAVAVTAIVTFAVTTQSVGAAPLAVQTPAALCGYRSSSNGTVVCITAAQAAAAQAAFPVVALGFDLAICTICASGLLEQRSQLGRALREPRPTAV